MLNNIKWLFFDVGSTLVDETDCYNHRIQDAIAGTNITFEEFNEKRMFFSKQNLKGDIEFNNVSFSYDKQNILNNISFKINAGKKTAFVGKTRCGKNNYYKNNYEIIS